MTVFWDELGKTLALYGPQALNARNAVLQLLKSCILDMWVDAADEPDTSLETVMRLTRTHLTGVPNAS
jgi:hypothetical protein